MGAPACQPARLPVNMQLQSWSGGAMCCPGATLIPSLNTLRHVVTAPVCRPARLPVGAEVAVLLRGALRHRLWPCVRRAGSVVHPVLVQLLNVAAVACRTTRHIGARTLATSGFKKRALYKAFGGRWSFLGFLLPFKRCVMQRGPVDKPTCSRTVAAATRGVRQQ